MEKEPSYKQPWIDELTRLQKSESLGIVIGVEISKPKPWAKAEKIIKLHNKGIDVKTIAKETGVSVITVERSVKTKGIDQRTGPQCEKYIGQVFSVKEALKLMPIPCSQNCACSWRTILRTDIVQNKNG